MKKLRKTASIFLSFMIVLGMMPAMVFAGGGEVQISKDSSSQIGPYYETVDTDGTWAGEPTLEGATQQSYADGQVKVNKTIKGTDQENVFDIDLEVITKDKIKTTELSEDAATVLVIDTSGSMDDRSRLPEAKKAAQAFIDEFAKSNAQRKIAIVSFSGWEDKDISGASTKQMWTDASNLKQQGSGQCGAISGLSANGGTNIEAGLQLAKNLLAQDAVKDIRNKNIVLLTDGVPTYGISSKADRTSTEVICPDGKYMIGNGQKLSHDIHGQIESMDFAGINRYAVYVGDEGLYCSEKGCPLHKTQGGWWETNVKTPVGTWLNQCGFTTYTTQDAGQLTSIFEQISEMILLQAQAWVLTDPMGEHIDFVEFNREANPIGEFSYSSNSKTITWDLKKALPKVQEDKQYTYQLSYRIRLDNLEAGFESEKWYPTNGITSMTYLIKEAGDDSPIEQSDLKTAYFNIPSVKGMTASTEFQKVDENNQPMEGVEFALKTADDENFVQNVVSNADGTLNFTNIPSGHTYILSETKAPEGYVKAQNQEFSVAYGLVSDIAGDGTIQNLPGVTNFTVSKIWEDNDDQEKKRPESITVNLLANGEVIRTATLEAPPSEQDEGEDESSKDSDINGDDAVQKPADENSDDAVQKPTDENSDDAVQKPADENSDDVIQKPTDVGPAEGNDDQLQENDENNSDLEKDNGTNAGPIAKMNLDEESEGDTNGDHTGNQQPTVVNEWTYTFDNLPTAKDGQPIVYTIEEVQVKDYLTEVKHTETGAVITNTYAPWGAMVQIPFTKIVEKRGEADPDLQTFTFEVDGGSGCTVQGNSITANAAGRFDGMLTIALEDIRDFAGMTLTIIEVNSKAEHWIYDQTQWTIHLSLAGEKEIGYTIEGPAEALTFTNAYDYTPPVDPPLPPGPPVPPDPPIDPDPDQPLPPDENLEDPDQPAKPAKPGQDLPDDEHLQADNTAKEVKSEDPDQPKTGDESSLALYLILTIGACGALTITVRRKRGQE